MGDGICFFVHVHWWQEFVFNDLKMFDDNVLFIIQIIPEGTLKVLILLM